MKALPTSTSWFETPSLGESSSDDAILMVQVGMALNALEAQARLGVLKEPVAEPPTIGAFRNLILPIATNLALLHEAVVLAQQNFGVLKRHAQLVGADDALLRKMHRLRDQKHPASPLLDRARNELVFHWDQTSVRKVIDSTQGFDGPIVWLERDQANLVQRVALDVLMHALFPDAAPASEDETPPQITSALDAATDAQQTLLKFFTAAQAGFLNAHKVQERSWRAGEAK